MKNLLIIISLSLIFPSNAKALTWAEFWEPFVENAHRYSRIRNRSETCYKIVRYEEYVPGNEWISGYVRQRSEKHTINCPY